MLNVFAHTELLFVLLLLIHLICKKIHKTLCKHHYRKQKCLTSSDCKRQILWWITNPVASEVERTFSLSTWSPVSFLILFWSRTAHLDRKSLIDMKTANHSLLCHLGAGWSEIALQLNSGLMKLFNNVEHSDILLIFTPQIRDRNACSSVINWQTYQS